MKKKLGLVFSLFLSAALVGCGAGQEASSVQEAGETAQKQQLTVGLISSISTLPIMIAEEKGYFETAGTDVNIEYFKSAKDRDAALQAGEIDGVLCDEIAIAIYQNAGMDMKITGMTDGGFKLVVSADSGISSISELAGKKVAISENTIIEYVLDRLLEENGMTADSVEKVAIPAMPTRLEMLNSGEIDAALMPSPFCDTAVANGGTSIEEVESDSDYYISVTAFLNDAIENKPEAIKAYYEGYNQAVDYINETAVSEYEEVFIERLGYSETMRGNIIVPAFRKDILPTTKQLEDVLDWCRAKEILTVELNPEQIVSDIAVK